MKALKKARDLLVLVALVVIGVVYLGCVAGAAIWTIGKAALSDR